MAAAHCGRHVFHRPRRIWHHHQGGAGSYFGVAGIPEAWVWKLMPLVGTMDIAMGVLALVLPHRWLWAWMSFWAL